MTDSEYACHQLDTQKTINIFNNSEMGSGNHHNYFRLLSNQTIVFFGDSVVRNQFVSLACLLYDADGDIDAKTC